MLKTLPSITESATPSGVENSFIPSWGLRPQAICCDPSDQLLETVFVNVGSTMISEHLASSVQFN